jgi:UDP-N-acetylmuramyl pentapeptide phosphotransferase/UDP-N-acetylglucosamine-1-phosphate transferase
MTGAATLALGLAVAMVVAALTRALLPHLGPWGFIDTPNARSSHRQPTPRAGGIAPVGVLLFLLAAAAVLRSDPVLAALALAATALAISGLIDDRGGLGAWTRLAVQLMAVLPALGLVLAGWPRWWPTWLPLAVVFAGLALIWVWFVNLYNFMDGIDGITGVETVSIGLGAALVAALAIAPGDLPLAPAGLALAGAGLGFLALNWSPARVFLGDVGSVPLGFLAGALLLALAASGQPAAAAILPAYHLTDATLTLLRRALAGEAVMQAHRSHAYQRALQRGLRADQVCLRLIGLNAILIALAVGTAAQGWVAQLAGVAAAYALSFALCAQLAGWRQR